MPLPIPTPPPDSSGGYLLLKYSNGTRTHLHRVHVAIFNLPASGATNDYTYSGAGSHGTELTVNATFAAYGAQWKNFYTSAFTLSVAGLFQMQSGVPVQVFPTPSPAAIPGVNTGSACPYPEAEEVISFRTQNGHRDRIILIEPATFQFATPGVFAANSGGNINQQLVAYVTGAGVTSRLAHDGSYPMSPATISYAYNRKLRRKYKTT